MPRIPEGFVTRQSHKGSNWTPDASDFSVAVEETLRGRAFLPDDVRTAPLQNYALKQLQGRLAYYEKQTARERSPSLRREFLAEANRTRAELRHRAAVAKKEAKNCPQKSQIVATCQQPSQAPVEDAQSWDEAA